MASYRQRRKQTDPTKKLALTKLYTTPLYHQHHNHLSHHHHPPLLPLEKKNGDNSLTYSNQSIFLSFCNKIVNKIK